MLGLLFRDTITPALEALSIVWEGAEHIFRRDPGTYGVTGLERVPLGAPTPLGRVYSGAARALGLSRAPLFQRRSAAGSITLSVALLSPPALILSGDVRQETPELRFHLGAMLAATLPQHVLLFGSPEARRVPSSGPGARLRSSRGGDSDGPGAAAHLAEVLWENIPARLQRRLRELCDDPAVLDYDAAIGAGRMAIRRAGLFVAEDFSAWRFARPARTTVSRSAPWTSPTVWRRSALEPGRRGPGPTRHQLPVRRGPLAAGMGPEPVSFGFPRYSLSRWPPC